MKLKDISKLFKKYVDQLDFAIEVGESGTKEVDDDIAAPQLKVLNLWVRTRDRALNRKNKSQARFIGGLMRDSFELLTEKKSRLLQIAMERGLIKNE